MKTIRRSAAIVLVVIMMLQQSVLAVERRTFENELDAAAAFADIVSEGEDTLYLSVPARFDFTLCYHYFTMMYRDAYVFEYVPSQMNSYIKIVYNDAEKHKAAEKEAARLAAALVRDDMDLTAKYHAIYEYLRSNCKYDMHAAMNQATEAGGDAFSAYGALVNGMAVCDGISAAFAMVCRAAGLPCIYVASQEMNHSWNVVLLGEEIRYVDVTYDMTAGTKDKYFMLDADALSADHTWDKDMTGEVVAKLWDERFVSAYTLNAVGGLFRGSDKGWELERRPTRVEAAIMLVRFLGLEQQALAGTADQSPFNDVNPNHRPYIDLLYSKGLTRGTSPDTFTPNEEISLRDYLTFMLRAMGYSEAADQFEWETAPEDALGLGVLGQEQYDKLTSSVFDRGMMAYASLSILKAENASGVPVYRQLIKAGALSEKKVEEILK